MDEEKDTYLQYFSFRDENTPDNLEKRNPFMKAMKAVQTVLRWKQLIIKDLEINDLNLPGLCNGCLFIRDLYVIKVIF